MPLFYVYLSVCYSLAFWYLRRPGRSFRIERTRKPRKPALAGYRSWSSSMVIPERERRRSPPRRDPTGHQTAVSRINGFLLVRKFKCADRQRFLRCPPALPLALRSRTAGQTCALHLPESPASWAPPRQHQTVHLEVLVLPAGDLKGLAALHAANSPNHLCGIRSRLSGAQYSAAPLGVLRNIFTL